MSAERLALSARRSAEAWRLAGRMFDVGLREATEDSPLCHSHLYS